MLDSSLKQQHDARMRQLDRLETAAKHTSDTQRAWRNRVVLKQNEVDAAKVCYTLLKMPAKMVR